MSAEEMSSDVVVVGGGHNALVCAAYLAEAGLTVTVLEGRDILGGNTMTEELMLPGWMHDSCSSAHVVIQANPLIRDDELGLKARYGLEYIITDPAAVLPLGDGESISIHSDLQATIDEFARWSVRDGAALKEMIDEWRSGLNRAHAYYTSGLPLPDDAASVRYEQLRRGTAWDFVMSRFEHPVVRRAMLWMGFATLSTPLEPGSGILPMAMMSGRIASGWTTPVGGSIALPRALERHIVDHGGRVLTDAWVDRFIVEDGRCVGVHTADGRVFRARRAVATSSHLKKLSEMLDVDSPLARDAAARWRPGLSAFAVHFALRRDAVFHSHRGPVRAAAGGLGSAEGLMRQMEAAAAGRVETESPWLLLMATTVVDPDRAPDGGGIFKMLTVAPELLHGKPWSDADGQAYAERLLEFSRDHVDGLEPENILAMSVETPTSLAAHNLSNIGGSCHGGEFVLDDGTAVRGWPDYRSDVLGLYLTGSTSHPGGSVTGRPGRNTARVILDDLGIGAATVMSTP
jgi:phytoene dehydrogenase-like protein